MIIVIIITQDTTDEFNLGYYTLYNIQKRNMSQYVQGPKLY